MVPAVWWSETTLARLAIPAVTPGPPQGCGRSAASRSEPSSTCCWQRGGARAARFVRPGAGDELVGINSGDDGDSDGDAAQPDGGVEWMDLQQSLGGGHDRATEWMLSAIVAAMRRSGFENGERRNAEIRSERVLPRWKTWKRTMVVSVTVRADSMFPLWSRFHRNEASVPAAMTMPTITVRCHKSRLITPSRGGRGLRRGHQAQTVRTPVRPLGRRW